MKHSGPNKVEYINFDNPAIPTPIGHYSHALRLPNGIILLSGIKAWLDGNSITNMPEGVINQTNRIFDIVEAILEELNLPLSAITRVQCFLADSKDYDEFNVTYVKRMKDHYPTRAVLGGNDLRGGAKLELIVDIFDISDTLNKS